MGEGEGKIPQVETKERAREWWDVARAHEVGFIGDMNGSIKAFIKNLLDLGYITVTKKGTSEAIPLEEIEKVDEKQLREINLLLNTSTLKWTGGDKPLVLLGDILGDRAGNGDRVFRLILSLERQGANITVLAGNHDIGAISALMGGGVSSNGLHDPILSDQAPMSEYRAFEDWSTGEYSEEMYQDPEMVEHIRQIKKMKVAEVIDDTFFVHADVHPFEFIDLYKKYNPNDALSFRETIQKMNALFHDLLEQGFPEIDGPTGERVIDHSSPYTRKSNFNELCKEGEILSVLCGWPANRFIKTKRRDRVSGTQQVEIRQYPDVFIKFLKERGINAYVFGHNNVFNTFTQDNTLIIPADGLSERSGETNDLSYSNGKIQTNGHIDISVGKTHGQTVRQK